MSNKRMPVWQRTMKVALGPAAADEPVARGLRRKVFLRLIPWLLTLYVIAYVDRVNVS